MKNLEGGSDQDVLCALGDLTKSDPPASDSFDLVLLVIIISADQHLFNRFKKIHVEKSIKTAAEVIDALHETPFTKLHQSSPEGGVRFGHHSHNIMLSGKFVQWTPAVEDF